jgi:predicted nucleic acid-binding protein
MRISAGFETMNDIVTASRVYIDTNIFIFYIEGSDKFFPSVKGFFEHLGMVGASIVTSEITVAECLYKPCQREDQNLIDIYEEFFEKSGMIELFPLDGPLTKQAALHGGQLRLKLIDSIHYESALQAGCDFFVSADTRFKSGPKMRVLTF